MKLLNSIILITLLFFTACRQNNSVKYIEKFPIEETLTGKVPEVQDAMLTITSMHLMKGKLVYYDLYC